MSVITYKITLEADGFSAIELPVSSFNYSSSSESFSGSFIIQGHDYASEIADRATGGVVTLIQTVDGVDTDFFEADVDQIDTFLSTDSNTYQISFTDGTYSQSAYSGSYVIDDKLSFASFQSANWSFRISELTPDIQHGISVSYNGIDYYITDVNYNYDSDSFGFLTLNEGIRSVEAEGTALLCITDVSVGDSIDDEFSDSCYVNKWANPFPIWWQRYFIYEGRYNYIDMTTTDSYNCFIKTYQLTLADETSLSIAITSSLDELSITEYDAEGVVLQGARGFECLIADTEITGVYYQDIIDDVFIKIGANGLFSGTLPAGIYTIKCLYWALSASGAIYNLSITEIT